jgi:arginase
MRVEIIGVPPVEVTGISSSHAGGLAYATDAYLNAGLLDELQAAGIEVAGVARPGLKPEDRGSDPIVNLGLYNAEVAKAVVNAIERGAKPVLAGGTCNHLVGMLSGLQQSYGPTSRIGLVWFDAHGDFNTPKTSYTQMLGGMPVAVSAGLCYPVWRELAGLEVPLATDRIVFVDVRNLDDKEEALINATAAKVVKFGEHGETDEIACAVEDLADRVDHIYLHVDADVLDASLQPNHPTAEPNGPGLAMVQAALVKVFETGLVRSYAVVSVNPTGPDGATSLASGKSLLTSALAAWSAIPEGE